MRCAEPYPNRSQDCQIVDCRLPKFLGSKSSIRFMQLNSLPLSFSPMRAMVCSVVYLWEVGGISISEHSLGTYALFPPPLKRLDGLTDQPHVSPVVCYLYVLENRTGVSRTAGDFHVTCCMLFIVAGGGREYYVVNISRGNSSLSMPAIIL